MKFGVNKIFLMLAMAAGVAFADPIPAEALTQGGLVMRDRQLRDIGLVMRGGRGGFIDIGYTYTPSSGQLPLKSKYGVHDGFAFRHHYGIFGSWVLDRTFSSFRITAILRTFLRRSPGAFLIRIPHTMQHLLWVCSTRILNLQAERFIRTSRIPCCFTGRMRVTRT